MTIQKSFKRLVRSRMEKTGESYTAARRVLLAGQDDAGADVPLLVTSDAAIRGRTGRGWEEWFDLLDDWGAAERSHREIARWVADQMQIEPLAWHAQAITVSYERARGLRVVGQRTDGFAATAQKTVAVPMERLFDAFVDESLRPQWLADDHLRLRGATTAKSARFAWGDTPSRVTVFFEAKGDGKSTVTLEHGRLADAAEADRMKSLWRASLAALKSHLEGGEGGA